jgi:beta-glucanase (GH16 family)
MTIPDDQLSDPIVHELVAAINAGDRERFFAVLAPGATMSDDGTERDLEQWVDREIFSAEGRMEVESESEGGLALIARYTNSTYGEMRTRWRFEIEGGKITRFETGQA